MYSYSKNIDNGKKVSRLASDIRAIGNRCESLTEIIPSKYRSMETSTILKEVYSIKDELSSIADELETLGESIISVSKDLKNKSSGLNGSGGSTGS